MSKNRLVIWSLLLSSTAAASAVATTLLAQSGGEAILPRPAVDPRDFRVQPPGQVKLEEVAGVPPAALLTERGRALATELQRLRKALAVMGAKHPLLDSTREAIVKIEQELAAWDSGDPQTAIALDVTLADGTAILNNRDLQSLIIQLTQRVAELETRIARLEAK